MRVLRPSAAAPARPTRRRRGPQTRHRRDGRPDADQTQPERRTATHGTQSVRPLATCADAEADVYVTFIWPQAAHSPNARKVSMRRVGSNSCMYLRAARSGP